MNNTNCNYLEYIQDKSIAGDVVSYGTKKGNSLQIITQCKSMH